MKKSSKLSLLTAGIAGTLLATSVASIALTACTNQTTPDSSQEQYNWFETQIDWTKPETYSKLYKDNQGVYYTSAAMTTVVGVTPEFSATTITLPSSVKRITGYINITNGKLIPTGAFESTNLESIKFLGTNLTNIGPQSFKDIKSLKEISLPNSVKTIEQQAFSGCIKIETINLENVISIGAEAFRETHGLKSLTFHNRLIKWNSIGPGAFMNSGLNGNLFLSYATNLYEIGSYAFSGTGLTDVVLPSSLTLLGAGVFQDCTQLSTVILGKTSNVKIIKPSTFQGCSSLSTITLPNNLTSIGQSAFQSSGLTSLDLSNTEITTLANSTFNNATKLETVKLPRALTHIGQMAFQDTTSLKNLTQGPVATNQVGAKLTSSITSIGNRAFQGTGLEKIDLSATLATNEDDFHSLGNSVFRDAASLNILTLPNGLTTIPAGMVAGDTALKTLNIPKSVTTINSGNSEYPGAFQGSGITDIDLSGTSLTTWKTPNNNSLDVGTFSNMTDLWTVKLPFSLVTTSGIAKDAFKGTSDNLNTIEFVYTAPAGKNLSNIGDDGDGTNFKASLKRIYEMFAGGNNDFDGQIADTNLKGIYNWWLPGTPIYLGPRRVEFNGITWVSRLTEGQGIPDDNGNIINYPEITHNARTITIEGTVKSTTSWPPGPFKYKYTDNIGHLASSNSRVQQLPSNIRTIKITLNNNEASPKPFRGHQELH